MEYRQLKQRAIEIQKMFNVKGPLTISILDQLDAGPGPIIAALNSRQYKSKSTSPRGKNTSDAQRRRAAKQVEKLVREKKLTKKAAYNKVAAKFGRSAAWAKSQHDNKL